MYELIFVSVLVLILGVTVYVNYDAFKAYAQKRTQSNAKKKMFTCPWFSLVKDGHYFYVDYGRPAAGVVIVPIVDGTHILMVKNYRFPLKQDSWELPRGFIDGEEDFFTAALRELKEETAYLGDKDHCQLLGMMAPDSSILNNKMPVVLVNLSSANRTNLELDPEISQVEKVALSELKTWMNENNVIDGISMAALYQYQCR